MWKAHKYDCPSGTAWDNGIKTCNHLYNFKIEHVKWSGNGNSIEYKCVIYLSYFLGYVIWSTMVRYFGLYNVYFFR